MLPGGDRLQGPLGVQGVGKRDVDRVDVRVVEDVVVRRVNPRDVVPLCELPRPGRVTRSDRRDGGPGYPPGRLDDGQRRDPRRAEDAEAQVGHASSTHIPRTSSATDSAWARPACAAGFAVSGSSGLRPMAAFAASSGSMIKVPLRRSTLAAVLVISGSPVASSATGRSTSTVDESAARSTLVTDRTPPSM